MPTSVSHAEPVFARVLETAGFCLVRLKMSGGQRKTLQVMAERPDGSMDVEGCAQLSELLADFLETEDPIGGDYLLEISSPGIDRPLTRLTDFSRWAGFDAKIELTAPLEGRKRFKAVLKGVSDNEVVFDVDGKVLQTPFSAIAEAKLVLTDRLIEADLQARQKTKPAASPSDDQLARRKRATGD